MWRKVRPRKILKGKGREELHKRFSKGVDDLQAYNHVFNLHRIVVIPYSPACILFFSLFPLFWGWIQKIYKYCPALFSFFLHSGILDTAELQL